MNANFTYSEYQTFETPYGNGYNISHGGYTFLKDSDQHTVARIPLHVERPTRLRAVQETAAREMEPWAPTVLKLAEAARARARAQEVLDAAAVVSQYQGPIRDDEREEELIGYIRQHATAEEWSNRRDIQVLANKVAARLEAQQRDLLRAASDALPDAAAGPLPDFDEDWQQVGQPSYASWLDRVRPRVIARWAKTGANDGRDRMIVWAVEHGASKADLHRLTGLARTTIDRVLNANQG